MAGVVLSKDAEAVAVGLWRFMPTALNFLRPHTISPQFRAALDELTSAGLLTCAISRNGVRWRPTSAMAEAVAKIRTPASAANFPMTTE